MPSSAAVLGSYLEKTHLLLPSLAMLFFIYSKRCKALLSKGRVSFPGMMQATAFLHPTTGQQVNRKKITGKQAGQLNSHHPQSKGKMDSATSSLFGALVQMLLSSGIPVLATSATVSGTVTEILMQPNTKLKLGGNLIRTPSPPCTCTIF